MPKRVKNEVVTSTDGKLTVIVYCNYDELTPVGQLKPNPANPNTHSTGQIDKLAKIIASHGWRHPVTVSKRSGLVVAGHARLLAAQKLGLKQVPVDYQTFCDEAEEYAVMVADNIIAELAETDGLKMADILCELDQVNYDLSLTGLDPAEIENYILGPTSEPDPKDDEVPEPPKKAITKSGDLWLLGEHRLLCADSTRKEDVERLCGPERPILCVTDPPYGVDYKPEWRIKAGLNKRTGRMGKVNNDDKWDWSEAYKLFDAQVLYVWHAGILAGEVEQTIIKSGYEIISQIIWVKDKFAISRGDYHWKHEPCWYAHKLKSKHNWRGARDQCTVWEINRVDKNEEAFGHGAQKPMECMARPIRNNTNIHDIVADPFLGTGTTLIACEKLGRIFFGMEIDPIYCDVAIERWQNFVGGKAKRIKCGGK